MKVEFKPVLDKKSNWYKIGIYIDGELNYYLHWIETYDGTMCKLNSDSIPQDMSLRAAYPLAENLESALGGCAQLQEMYDNGEIK